MILLIDTSVWSLAFRRDGPAELPEVAFLRKAIDDGETVVTTGLILQELLQGFYGPKQRRQVIERFGALPHLVPDRHDHIEAAALRNKCRRSGVQLGTIDALLAQLSIRYNTTLLSTDNDFLFASKHIPLRVWRP